MKRLLITICCASFVFIAAVTNAATLSPSLLELEGKRGEVVTDVMQIVNTEEAEQIYYLDVLKFQASEDGRTPVFISFDQDHSGLPEWIVFDRKEIQVPARTRVEVPFKIAIPADAESGGYYAGITVSTAPSEIVAANSAVIEAKTAMLLLLTVSGETQKMGALLDLDSDTFGHLTTSIDGSYTYRVQNQGNVHLQPTGVLRFTDFLGRTVYETDANVSQGRVLPKTTRAYTVEIDTDRFVYAMGPITATLDLTLAQEIPAQAQATLWLFPIPLLLGMLIAVVCIFLLSHHSSGNRH